MKKNKIVDISVLREVSVLRVMSVLKVISAGVCLEGVACLEMVINFRLEKFLFPIEANQLVRKITYHKSLGQIHKMTTFLQTTKANM